MLQAVAPAVKVQAEITSEPTVREAPETAFGEVVARAVAKCRVRDACESSAEEPKEPESGDASLCAYVAALVSQSPAIPLPHQDGETAGDVILGASAEGSAARPIPVMMAEAQSVMAQGMQAPAPQFDGKSALPLNGRFAPPISPQRAQAEQRTQAEQPAQGQSAQPFAEQAVLMNPQGRQKANAAEIVNASLPRSVELEASGAVRATPLQDAPSPDAAPVAGRNAAGSANAEAGAANRSADRYVQVQAQAEKSAVSGKGEASQRAFSVEDAAPRPVEERRATREPVLPTQRQAEPILRAYTAAEVQRPETAPSPREADTAAQIFRATASALSRGETSFRLKLRPEGLGEITVSISARDRELHLTMRTQSESTREIILNQIGELRLELASSDYHLSGFSVDVSGGGAGGEAFSAFQDGQERRSAGRRPPEPRATPALDAPLRGAPEIRLGAINLRA